MIYIVSDFSDDYTKNLSCDHIPKSSMEIVKKNINELGYECSYFGGIKELADAYSMHNVFNDCDLFFNMSDGLTQKSRRMQAPVLFDLLGVKYTGSTPFAIGLMSNKHFSKQAAAKCKVNIPNGILISNAENDSDKLRKYLLETKYPLIIKPNNEGSSIGIDNNSIVYNYKDAMELIKKNSFKFEELIIEEFIIGTDACTLIVGNYPNIQINETMIYSTYNNFILTDSVRDTYVKENWISKGYTIDQLSDYKHLSSYFKDIGIKIFKYIGCNDIARIDYRISPEGKIYFLEINSMPTITPTSDVGMICTAINKPYSFFLNTYLESAFFRYGINHD